MPSIDQLTEEVQRRMQRKGLARIADPITALLRPSIRFLIGDSSAEPRTRLGGMPNLPADIPWPARKDGSLHSFLMQVDLAQLDDLGHFHLPRAGSLFFFCDAVDIPAGFDPGDKDGFKVIYAASPLAGIPQRTSPRELGRECIFEGFLLEPQLELTAPNESWEIQQLRFSPSEADAYSDLFHSDGIVHRIGGYPDIIQNDDLELKAELVSHGIYCGGPEGYREGRNRKLEGGAANWRFLAQIDSEERSGMMWGDLGKLYFLIREQDLKAQNFDCVWMDMQCG
jgi:uncharacterized protein YwqG